MTKYRVIAGGTLLATALTATACGSNDGSESSASTSSTATSSTSADSGPPSGGPGGAGGGMGQTFTAVDLDTEGASAGGANTAEVVPVVQAFLDSLDAETRDAVEYDFTDNQSRQTWSNFPTSTVAREGVALSDLSADQQQAALAILQTALSSDGSTQTDEIRASDDYLNSLGGQGADGFGSLVDYYIAIYGEPSTSAPFMVQFGGHHLARNLTYNGDAVSQTPQFVGTEPTTFEVDGTTVEPLAAESDAMFGMLAGLDADQLASAEITSGTFDDLVMGPGADTGVFPEAEGLVVSELPADQQALVTAAIEAYVGDLSTEAAAAVMAQYESELDETTIGWSNNTGPTEENSYVRIDGPSVWIEFINTRSMSTPDIHFHSVYRDKNNDYGSTNVSE